ncbi:MAG: sigma-54-dependent Fis family transcriptional regulator [Acidobacteriaceae bacterium]|nr:sigma-54-dependent Fis family transcriptional regulator [Acidobacteriaceae bacterium]
MARLLVVDDERNIRVRLASFFEGCGHVVQTAESGKEALELLFSNEPADLVLTDYKMAELNGVELLQQIKHQAPDTTVILMTAYGTIENAVVAMKAGAYDYLAKPFSLEQVQHVVERALELQKLRAENRTLRDTVEERPLLESKSIAMRRLLDTARQAARSEATILLTGESGTGKNVLARQMHHWSPRREHSFVVVNCTTLSEHLLESELFGHVRGAFTGAIKDKPGRLEAADRGSVFLDEIGDLTPALQTKFLRFVQEQSFERVGGAETVRVNTRILAASNRDLAAEVVAHRFRDDLFYRLNVITLRVPPLRERTEDILPLAERMLQTEAIRNHRSELCFSPQAVETLTGYRWPGNVRELRNAVERAVVLASGDTIVPEHLPDNLFRESSDSGIGSVPKNIEEMERELIIRVLAESPTLEDAAQTLGINASTLWRKRKRYKIE